MIGQVLLNYIENKKLQISHFVVVNCLRICGYEKTKRSKTPTSKTRENKTEQTNRCDRTPSTEII